MFTILPGGQTALHRLYRESDIIDYLYKQALSNKDDVSSLRYSVPYLKDMVGNCPVSLCREKDSLKSLNFIIKYLSGQGIDHHSRLIYKHLPYILEMEINTLPDYLNSRNIETKMTKNFTRENIDEDY